MDGNIETDNWLDIHAASVMRDGRCLLDHVTLAIARGTHTVVLGPNGSGKSTLVKLIERRLYPLARDPDGATRPHVRLFGRERWHIADLKAQIGVVSADVQREFADEEALSAFDAVVSGFLATRGTAGVEAQVTPAQRAAAGEALARVGIAHLADRIVGTLSSGEARRVLIARALVFHPQVLLLDEPCSGLDMASRRRFLDDLRGLARGGTTLVMVTHHVEEILPEMQRVVMLRDGQVLADGHKQALLDDAHLTGLFGLPVEVKRSGDWYSARLR
ncbi:MAG TPA: ATP-binding cassette domain-containing protein [Rhodanobacteraceae bacterium]